MTENRSRSLATEVVDQILLVVPKEHVGRLTGLDLANERSAFLEELRDSGVKGVVFDLAGVPAFGSQMLGTLVLAWKQARHQGATMVLCNLSDTGRQVLERSRLDALWPISTSRDQALASFPRSNRPCATVHDTDTARLRDLDEKTRDRLRVIQSGLRTVVGFGGADLPPEHALGRYLAALNELIDQNGCLQLVFDLAGVSAIPSGFLGLLASILKRKVDVSVKNASREVRAVLALTNFDRLVKVE
jgi:anti-anti-sigma factor